MAERILLRNPNFRPERAQVLARWELATQWSVSFMNPIRLSKNLLEGRALHGLQVRLADVPWYWARTAIVTGTMLLRHGIDKLADSERTCQLQRVLRLHGYHTSGLHLQRDAKAGCLSEHFDHLLNKTSSRLYALQREVTRFRWTPVTERYFYSTDHYIHNTIHWHSEDRRMKDNDRVVTDCF